MKKEWIAAGILALLAAFSAWNLCHIKNLTNSMTELLETSRELYQCGDWDPATRYAQRAERIWAKTDNYMQIFMAHPEIDSASDAFYDYLAELYKRDDGGADGTYKKLISQLTGIYEMEKITLKSVF